VDLSPVIGPDTEWGKTLVPAAVQAFQYNGKYFGIPLYLDAKFMGYSKKIFADLGLDAPANFEQLLGACDKIREKGITPISFGNKEAWPAVHYAGQLLAFNVPQATLEQDFDPKKATYSDPGYVASLQQFKDLVDRCTDGAAVNGTSYSSALQALSNGKSAMYYQEIIEFDQAASAETELKPADFGFFVLPVAEDAKGDPKAVEGAPEGYMISAASDNIPLAIDFMKFVTSPEHGQILSAPPYGQPSATVGGASEATMSPSVVNGLTELKSASYLMPWLDTANSPRVAAAWLANLQALVGGSMTPEEVMSKVKEAAAADAN
jgi:raffinose/stachyose/melibiose transport system substrate-binding protein